MTIKVTVQLTPKFKRSSCPHCLSPTRYHKPSNSPDTSSRDRSFELQSSLMNTWKCARRGYPTAPMLFISLACVSVALLSFVGCDPRSDDDLKTEAPAKVLNVKDFGAKGDGRSDDYDALQAAASALCHSPNATLLFPEGTYRIGRHRIAGGPDDNGFQNIRYVGCKGNTITGVKVTIDVEGDFRRRADKRQQGSSLSYADNIVPFEMVQSSGFRIVGFQLVGNVDKMTRDPDVAPGGAAGILTIKCRDYYIEDLTVRGFGGDGIRLGEDSQSADQGVHLVNVTSTRNARQGLTIVNVRGANIVSSVFTENGRTGAYGSHPPAAGVAVEPVRYTSDQDPAGDITFERCRFEENLGPQFLSERPDLVDSITISDSYVKSTLPDTSATAFMSTPKSGLVRGSTFDVAAGRGVALAGYSPDLYANIKSLVYNKNNFNLGDNKGLISPVQPAPVELTGNNVRVEKRTQDSTLLRLDYVKLFEKNIIFEANTGYSGVHPTILYEKGNATVRDNTYLTDRTGPGYFDVYYGHDVVASGETFQNPTNFKRY
jgi:hypothetical protein